MTAVVTGIQHQEVISSNVASFGYDVQTSTLEVTFKNGRTYQYLGVPMSTVQDLRNAQSTGAFIAQNIRDKFRCIPV